MLRLLPTVIEPDVWTLAFHRTSPHWWVRLLAFGKYKHVSAFAWVAPLRLWLVFDVTLVGLKLRLLPDSKLSEDWLLAHTNDADLLQIRRQLCKSYAPSFLPLYCVPAIKSLIGLRCGALRPDALYRDCLAHGGQLIHGPTGSTPDRPRDRCPAAAGQG